MLTAEQKSLVARLLPIKADMEQSVQKTIDKEKEKFENYAKTVQMAIVYITQGGGSQAASLLRTLDAHFTVEVEEASGEFEFTVKNPAQEARYSAHRDTIAGLRADLCRMNALEALNTFTGTLQTAGENTLVQATGEQMAGLRAGAPLEKTETFMASVVEAFNLRAIAATAPNDKQNIMKLSNRAAYIGWILKAK